MNIGHQLYNLLEENGVRQKELADFLNLSASTINGYVKNRRQPDANTLVRLASYFNTSTDYIYGLTSVKEPFAASYTAEERLLIHIYRSIPDDKKSLFLDTGRLFARSAKNRTDASNQQ